MKNLILCSLFFLFMAGALYAQESIAKPPSAAISKDYISKVKDYAVLFNGKEQMPYFPGLTNHPYLVTSEYVAATLTYNQVEYQEVMLRWDMYRDELVVRLPDRPFNVVLESEKMNYAVLNGHKIVSQAAYPWVNGPTGRYVLLLHEGRYPVIKKEQVSLEQKIDTEHVEYTFQFRERIYICIDDVCHRVTNKKSVLKLFPDKRKELDAYAKQQKLNFSKERERSIVAMVKQYEALNR